MIKLIAIIPLCLASLGLCFFGATLILAGVECLHFASAIIGRPE